MHWLAVTVLLVVARDKAPIDVDTNTSEFNRSIGTDSDVAIGTHSPPNNGLPYPTMGPTTPIRAVR